MAMRLGLVAVVLVLAVSSVCADTWTWAEPRNYAPQPRFQHSANRVGNKLVVFGGTLSNDVTESDVHVMDTDSKTWTTPVVTGAKPSPTSGHASVTWQEQVIVLFGSIGGSMTNRVHMFDPDTNAWTRIPSSGRIPTPRAYHSAVVVDGQVYTFGGFDGRFYLNEVHKWEVFDPAVNGTGNWLKLVTTGDIPDVRAGASVAVYGRKMFVFGGFEVAVYKNDFYQLDLDTLHWSRIHLRADTSCPMPSSRAFASMTLVGTRLVVFGGVYCASNGTCTELNDVHQYDIFRSEMTNTPPAGPTPPARYGHSASLFGSKVMVFGGSAYPNMYNDIFHYDVYDNAWSEATGVPPYARKQHSMVMYDAAGRQQLVVFGGKHGSGGYSNHLHVFDIGTSKWSHPVNEGFPPPPVGNHAAAMHYDDYMLVFGGFNGTHSSNDVYSVDLLTTAWEKVDVDGNLPAPCHGHTVVTTSGEYLQFGGVDCQGDDCRFFNDLHALSKEALSWSRVEVKGTPPRPRASHSMTAVGPSHYLVFGGVSSYFTNLNDLYAYDDVQKGWAFVDTIGSKPDRRFGHTAEAYRGNLVVFGGAACHAVGDCLFYNDVHMFIPHTLTWTKLSIQGHYPAGRSGATSALLGPVMYVFAGGAKGRMFSDLLTIEPASSVAANTVVYGAGKLEGTAGAPVTFVVQTQDGYRENRTTGGDRVSVKVTPTSHLAVQRLQTARIALNVTDLSNGLYVANYTTNTTDLYNVTVWVNGEEAERFQAVVRANLPSANTSVAHGPGLAACVAGEECAFSVDLFDAHGNKLDRKTRIDVDFIGPRRVLKRVKDNASGTHKVTYVPEKAGHYAVHVRVLGQPVQGAPFNLTVSPGAASKRRSRVGGEGLLGSRAGVVGNLVLTLFDAFENPVPTGSDEVKAQLIGPDQLACDVENHHNGTYSISYTAVRIGQYQLNVVLNDEVVEGSPFEVDITNAPVSPATTFAYGSGLRYAIAGYRAYFTIQTADDFGNNMTTGGAQFNVLFAGPGDAKILCNVTDHGDGKYSVSYVNTAAGDFMISATMWNSQIGYQSIHLSPFLGFAVASGADPFKSYMYLEQQDKPLTQGQMPFHAVMGVHSYFHIQAVDRYGNRKTTGGDKFSAELEGPATHTAIVSDKGDGTYVGVYVAPAAGKYWLKVFYGNVALQTTPVAVVVRSNFDMCPNECSARGVCRNNQCVCDRGYAGVDCSIETGNCERNCLGNGACLNNTCFCYPGFTGPACEDSTTLCPNDCSKHGECVDALCVCDEGYEGVDCANNTRTCMDGCLGNGECVDGNCLCYPGFSGNNCADTKKFCPKGCSGRGQCMTGGMCRCNAGWTGLDCSGHINVDVLPVLAQQTPSVSDLPDRLPRKK